jgi:hypothetical protein
METVTLTYDSTNLSIRKALELLFTLGVKEESVSGYDPAFVSKIKRAALEPSKSLNLAEYGISI